MTSPGSIADRRPRILIVDDDAEIRELLSRFLDQHGLNVTAAGDGTAMMGALEQGTFDLIVLDLMMPGEDGLALCRRLRQTSQVPVIMLTAMREDIDRIIGLEVGADDYLGKPFNPRELLARIKAVLRRASNDGDQQATGIKPDDVETPTRYRFAQWHLDTGTRQVVHDRSGAAVDLTSGEFDLLTVLVERPMRVLTRDQLLDLTRGRTGGPFDRSVDVMVSRLRRKLDDDPADPTLIKTVRGGGYQLAVPVAKD